MNFCIGRRGCQVSNENRRSGAGGASGLGTANTVKEERSRVADSSELISFSFSCVLDDNGNNEENIRAKGAGQGVGQDHPAHLEHPPPSHPHLPSHPQEPDGPIRFARRPSLSDDPDPWIIVSGKPSGDVLALAQNQANLQRQQSQYQSHRRSSSDDALPTPPNAAAAIESRSSSLASLPPGASPPVPGAVPNITLPPGSHPPTSSPYNHNHVHEREHRTTLRKKNPSVHGTPTTAMLRSLETNRNERDATSDTTHRDWTPLRRTPLGRTSERKKKTGLFGHDRKDKSREAPSQRDRERAEEHRDRDSMRDRGPERERTQRERGRDRDQEETVA